MGRRHSRVQEVRSMGSGGGYGVGARVHCAAYCARAGDPTRSVFRVEPSRCGNPARTN